MTGFSIDTKKQFVGLTLLFMAIATAGPSSAQPYPNKPIKIIQGFAAGSVVEITARLILGEVGKRLGQPFVVEGRPGAGGGIAASAVMNADPDGYSLLYAPLISLHPVLTKNSSVLGGKDLAPVSDVVAGGLYLFVRSSLGVKTLQELVAYAKANTPGKLNYGSQSGAVDLSMTRISDVTGITYTVVRFKGPPVTEMLNGTIDIFIGSIAVVLPHIREGKIAGLFRFGAERSDLVPTIPAGSEIGLPYLPGTGFGLWAPIGTSPEIRSRLSAEIAVALKLPHVLEQLRKLGFEASPAPDPNSQMRAYEQAAAFFVDAARRAKFEPQ